MTDGAKNEATAILRHAWDHLGQTAPNLGMQEAPTTETTAIHIISAALIAVEFNRPVVEWKKLATINQFPY